MTDSKLTRTDTISGLSLPISEVQPSYDAAGNVSSVTTTLAAVGTTPGGSETQAFCYDDLDRLTWAGTSVALAYYRLLPARSPSPSARLASRTYTGIHAIVPVHQPSCVCANSADTPDGRAFHPPLSSESTGSGRRGRKPPGAVSIADWLCANMKRPCS